MNDVRQIELSAKERKALKAVEKRGCISDEVRDVSPYDLLLRLDLLEYGYSDDYPYTPPPADVVELPFNVLVVSDFGRMYLNYKRNRKSETWKSRIWGYVLGALSGVTVTLLSQYIAGLLGR